MNCCDYDCTQGRDCPIRTGKPIRRVRAGQPVGDDTGCLPVEFTEQQLQEWERDDDRLDRDDVLTLLSAIALVVVTLTYVVVFVGAVL